MVLVLKKGASKKEIESNEKKLNNKGGVDVMKHCGKIKLKVDALVMQNELRDQWQ